MTKHKHHKEERTFVIVKPDGVQRSLIGEIIGRYERIGLKLIGLKVLIPPADMIEKHYTIDPEWMRKTGEKNIANYKKKGLKPPSEDPLEITKIVLKNLKLYMTSGPVVLMVWQGAHAVEIARKVTGGTEPRSTDVGSIRGDFVLDSYQMADSDSRAVRNLVHSSGSVQEAEKEIAHWFKKDELIQYKIIQERILYDINLDGIQE